MRVRFAESDGFRRKTDFIQATFVSCLNATERENSVERAARDNDGLRQATWTNTQRFQFCGLREFVVIGLSLV